MNNYLKSLLLALLLVTGEAVRSAVQPSLGVPLSLVVSFTAVVALYSILDHRVSYLRHWKWYRRRFYKPGRFEGFYVSTVSDSACPVSVSKIYYDKGCDAWIHHGYGLAKDGTKAREWEVKSIHFDDKTDDWFFDGKWWKLDYVHRHREPERGGERDQLSIITTTRKPLNPITSTYVDGPRHPSTFDTKADVPRSGRATMYWIDRARLHTVCEMIIEDVEDISVSAGCKIFKAVIANKSLINEMRQLNG